MKKVKAEVKITCKAIATIFLDDLYAVTNIGDIQDVQEVEIIRVVT